MDLRRREKRDHPSISASLEERYFALYAVYLFGGEKLVMWPEAEERISIRHLGRGPIESSDRAAEIVEPEPGWHVFGVTAASPVHYMLRLELPACLHSDSRNPL